MICLGFDTSNYTTSVASYDGRQAVNCSRLLPVEQGALGLRQSEALFSHVKRLPELSDRLFAQLDPKTIQAVGVSTRPRAVEGSYMPCFLAGESQARVLAAALHLPLYCFSHQQGHIAAVIWSAGRMDLLGQDLLAWHLSGGTTELLLVHSTPAGDIDCQKIGGTTDISAGQLIDRTGQLLGLDFPAGKALDLLAAGNRRQATGTAGGSAPDAPGASTAEAVIGCPQEAPASQPFHSERSEESASQPFRKEYFKVKVNGCEFSLSGVQNQVQNYRAKGASDAETAYFALRSVVEAVKKATKNAKKEYPLPVLFSGGVASNSMLRRAIPEAIFGAPQYSTDNGAGIAVLTWLKHKDHKI
ncbi:MAG: DNA-binding protein [Oscillospiraceae bacterium]|nr:DNA-binding protein [Oscillospiraceae bacterium]